MCRQLTLVTFVIFSTKRRWGNQYRKIELQSKKQPKLRGEPDAEVWLRSAADPLLWNRLCLAAAAPTQAPATSGPCPAASGRFPPQDSAAGAVTTTGPLPNAPPRAASPLFTFKIAFPWRPRRKQTCRLPLRAMGYVCLSGSHDIAAYLSEGSLGRIQSSEGP